MADQPTRLDPRRSPGFMAAAIGGLMMLMAGSVQAATVPVSSINFQFQPQSRTINAGDVVSWTFAGDPHTVTSGVPGSPDGRFDSGIEDAGGSFQVAFATAGTFPYFCQIHPEQMVGRIVVQAAANPAPTVKPTPKPTARPTPKPTARPTPKPTARPTAAPTARPTAAAASAVPTAAAASAAPSPSQVPSASPPPSVEAAASGSLDAVAIPAVAIVAGLLVAGGVAIARRPRAG